MAYASTTTVSPEKTRVELETLLRKHGAKGIATVWDEDANREYIEFKICVGEIARVCRLEIPLPILADFEQTEQGRARKKSAAKSAFDQSVKSRWRTMLLMTRAKLEAIEIGATVFEQEFLSTFVLGDGRTVGEALYRAVLDAERGR